MRRYETLKRLRAGEVVELDGRRFHKIGEGEDIQPGDLYIAERNTGPKLLTCHRNVGHGSGNLGSYYIVPTTINYSYDWDECVMVEEATKNADNKWEGVK